MNKSQILILIGLIVLVWFGYMYDRVTEIIDDSSFAPSPEVASNKERHGEVKQYTKSGKLKTIVNYQHGKKHGVSYLYHYDGETILLAMPYENGQREGTSSKYYEGGEIYAETNYHHDQLHGVRTVYYRSGKIKSKVYYQNGQPGTGTEEYLTSGEKKEATRITYQKHGDIITLKPEPFCEEAQFFIGTLEDDKYFYPYSDKLRMVQQEDGQFYIDLNVFTPSFLEYQDVICSCKSTQGNPIVIKKRIDL